jgi:Zn-dependent peptidase ImmA (M78 family)
MRDWLIEEGQEPLAFIGSIGVNTHPVEAADSLRGVLRLVNGWAGEVPSWTDAMRRLRIEIEGAGIIVVVNGVVGNNTHRKLDPEEFRGFALVDEYAPLIFVNGTDARAAQMFTLVHELVHIWVGEGGVSNFEDMEPLPNQIEEFCNWVAAEFLVPESELRAVWPTIPRNEDSFQFLARRFKVSSLVAARRALDLELIDREAFFNLYREWQEGDHHQRSARRGGDFWNNQNVRIGRLFGSAVVRAAKEGRLLYQDAYSLTGLRGRTFDSFVRQMEESI